MQLYGDKEKVVKTVGELIDTLSQYGSEVTLECLNSSQVNVIEWRNPETDEVEMIELEDNP